MKMKRALLSVLIVVTFAVFLTSCSSEGPSRGQKGRPSLLKTPEMEKAFAQAEAVYADRRFLEAETLYQSYLKNFPFNILTLKAYFRLGELRFREKDYEHAVVLYRKATEKYVDPDWGINAVYKQAVCYSKLEDFKKALVVLDDVSWERLDGKVGVRIGSLRVSTAKRVNDVLQEEKGYLEVIDSYEVIDPSEAKVGELNWIVSQNTARQEVDTWVAKDSESQMVASDIRELEKWITRFEGKTSGGTVSWKLARLYYQKGDYSKSLEWTQHYLNQYPRHDYRDAARTLLLELGKRGAKNEDLVNTPESSSSSRMIGVLLPLSGKYAVYGESVLHGLECATGVFSPCRGEEGTQLVIRDTKGDPRIAASMIDEFAKNPSIKAVIGPLPQVEIDQAAEAAERNQIPMISLSQRADVAKKGEYVFRNFLTVEDQVMTLVDYVCNRERIKKFAILYPQGQTGEEYKRVFSEAVAECGGRVMASGSYPEGARNLTDAVRGLFSGSEGLSAEVKAPFQALFIPDVYRRVPVVIDALSLLNVKNVKLLGGAGWNHPGLLAGNAAALEGAVFVDGFFAQNGMYGVKDFVNTYQSAYGMEPTILEAYAFDTLKLVSTVLREHDGADRMQIKQFLLDKKNFPGVTGEISFDEEGDARRRLSILEIENGEIKLMDKSK